MGSASGPVICPTFRGRNSDGFHSVHICKFLFVLITTKISYGRLAQLGERSVRNAEVVGSIPISSTRGRLAFASLPFYAVTYTRGCLFLPCSSHSVAIVLKSSKETLNSISNV